MTLSTDDGQQTTRSQVVNPAQERVAASSSGADHSSTTEPRCRDRKRRTPLNGVMGDTIGGMHSAKIVRVGGEGNVASDFRTIYPISYASHNSGGIARGVLCIFS